MDRTLKKGTIGLSVAWLAHAAADKQRHDELKRELSSGDALGLRQRARQQFRDRADVEGGLPMRICVRESALRAGDITEPAILRGVTRRGKGGYQSTNVTLSINNNLLFRGPLLLSRPSV